MTSYPKLQKHDRLGYRKRLERKKKDKLCQIMVSQEGICQNCKQWKQLYGDHKIKRRFGATRHDMSNIFPLCAYCNVEIESLPFEKLLQKYPHSLYAGDWEEELSDMRKVRELQKQIM